MRYLLAALALSLCACASPAAQTPNSVATQAGVRAIVEAESARQRLIGVQYAVLHQGRIVAEAAFGELDHETRTPATPDSEMLIASVTKTMTGAIALRLVERGALNLDAPIQTYVPNFPTHPDGVTTPRLLLLHRAGIRHYNRGELGPALFAHHYDTANAALAVFIADPYRQAPGAGESYSSYGFDLLAAAMENVTHKTFTQILTEEVFTPLRLDHAHVPSAPLSASYSYFDVATNRASEQPLKAPVNDYSYNPGAGNIIANARSLVAFGRAFVRPGYLSASSLALITANLPATPLPPTTGCDPAMGCVTLATARYGWVVGRDAAGRLFLHATGASEAFQAGLTVFPDQDLVIAALTNTWGVNSRAGGFTIPMHLAIAAQVLGSR